MRLAIRRATRLWHRDIYGDELFRRLTRNSAYLFSASAVSAFLGLLTLAATANALGATGLGVLAIIEAYAKSVERLINFEPWQALVRYGTSALEREDRTGFLRLVKASTLFDIGGATLAGTVAMLLAGFASGLMKLEPEQASMATIYSATLFFGLWSTPTALLRIFDKFHLIAKFTVALAAFRLAMTVGAWWLSAGLWWFIAISMIFAVALQLVPLAFAWRELRLQGYRGVFATPLKNVISDHPGILRFIWNANLNVVLRTATQRFDVLIVAAILGPSATGLYQIARRSAQAAMVVARPIQQAIYPDIARLWARGEHERFRRIMLFTNFTIGVTGLITLFVVSWKMRALVDLFFGPTFADAAPLIIVQGFAIVLFLAGTTLNPALLSMGRDATLARITLFGFIVFFIMITPMIYLFGAIGANFTHVVFNVIWLTGASTVMLRATSAALKPAADLT